MLSTLMCTVSAVQAQDGKVGPAKGIPCIPSLPCITQETQKSGQGTRDEILNNFGSSFITAFIGLIAVASVIFIIVGGVRLHTSMGNEEAVGAAKKIIIWAIAGLAISLMAAALVSIVSRVNFGA